MTRRTEFLLANVLGVFFNWCLTAAPGRERGSAEKGTGEWFSKCRRDVSKTHFDQTTVALHGFVFKPGGREGRGGGDLSRIALYPSRLDTKSWPPGKSAA